METISRIDFEHSERNGIYVIDIYTITKQYPIDVVVLQYGATMQKYSKGEGVPEEYPIPWRYAANR